VTRGSPPGALILGGDKHALGIARSLGRRGIEVRVVHEPMTALGLTSRYVAASYRWAAGEEPARVAFLCRLAGEEGLSGWTVYPTEDETVALVSRNHDLLARHYKLTVQPWDVIATAADKRRLYEFAAMAGVPIPWTRAAVKRADLERLDCPLPCVVKPATTPAGRGAGVARAWRADTPAALELAYRTAVRAFPESEMLVQELVPGGGQQQFSFAGVFSGGRPVGSVVARRSRQYPVEFGRSSSFVETVDVPAVEKLGSRLLMELGYTGIAEVEFKLDVRDGRYKLLDLNPRVWTWHALAARAGVDVPYLMWRVLGGDVRRAVRAPPGVRWVRMATDVPAAVSTIRRRELTLAEYARTFRPPLEFAVYARDDPVPALVDMPLAAAKSLVTRRPRRMRYTAGVGAAVLRQPSEGVERIAERVAAVRKPTFVRELYEADPEWLRSLHSAIGAPWPCDEADAFRGVWDGCLALLESKGLAAGRGAFGGWDDADPLLARAGWCIIRHTRPVIAVETGVGRGVLTRCMLEAQERNGLGHLWSIDIPPLREASLARESRAALPGGGHPRWTYVSGSSRRRLPGLLAELGALDLFVHDSMHTDRNVRFELGRAWASLAGRGTILVDDVDRTRAFHECARRWPTARAGVGASDDGRALIGFLQKADDS
jgi:D-aspartate ligase